MPGFRFAVCCLVGAAVYWPFTVKAEEPSELLQHNDVGSTYIGEEESDLPSFSYSQQSPHAGLLGKRYFGGAYVYGRTDDGILDHDFLNDAYGFALSLNSPLVAGDGTKPVAMDVFAGYSQFFGRDSQLVGFTPVTGNLDLNEFELGVTIYTELIPRIRPFTQLGWSYARGNLSIESPFGVIEMNHHDTSMLLILGSEFDLSKEFTFRGSLDVDTQEFKTSTLTGELIYSPGEMVFFRMGAFMDLDSNFYGAIVGGGVKF